MSSHSFGGNFRLSIFGESHGVAIGGVIEGCPPGLAVDEQWIQKQMDRRRPANTFFASQRHETDIVEWLSGIENGISNGFPIAFIIRNSDQRTADYKALKNSFRPSHADFTYYMKYGLAPPAGTGMASARLMAPVVAGGGIARIFLQSKKINIVAYVDEIGGIKMKKNMSSVNELSIDESLVRCPDKSTSVKMEGLLRQLQKRGDTTGGTICCTISGCPAGIGDPIFEKLQARLAHAIMSIPSVKGFEYGSGFAGTAMTGSEHNDIFIKKDGVIATKTNHSGGIQGGISNGMDITFRVAFKPVSAIHTKQQTLDVNLKKTEIAIKGRHDICVVPRAVPIVEAMAALVVTDSFLRNNTTC
ncbi:MAG: chorismate synthase [Bacteroidota bacterium]